METSSEESDLTEMEISSEEGDSSDIEISSEMSDSFEIEISSEESDSSEIEISSEESDSTEFPLFDLPVGTAEGVVRLMTVEEQYKLADLSDESKRAVQSVSRTENMEWIIGYNGIVTMNIKNHSHPNEYLYLFEPTEGTDKLLETVKDEISYVHDMFNFSSVRLFFLNDRRHRVLCTVIEYLKKLKIHLDEVSVCSNFSSVPSNIMNKILLHECASAKDFKLTYEITGDFEMKFWECPKFKNKSIQISEAQWIESRILNNCFMDCESVVLSKCDVSPSDLNSFLKKWIHGADIKEIIISLRQRVDRGASVMKNVLHGIESKPIHFAYLYKYKRVFDADTCFLIHQNTGKAALVYQTNQDFCLTTKFLLDSSEPAQEEVAEEEPIMVNNNEDSETMAVNAHDNGN
uniref:FBA_2 domain-containing protein n=1 Tax=Caenorhabditis tropicalis TaxID=1561998 RepID=A0A1I7UAD6_9PELO